MSINGLKLQANGVPDVLKSEIRKMIQHPDVESEMQYAMTISELGIKLLGMGLTESAKAEICEKVEKSLTFPNQKFIFYPTKVGEIDEAGVEITFELKFMEEDGK